MDIVYKNNIYIVVADRENDCYNIFNKKTKVKEYAHPIVATAINQADAMESAFMNILQEKLGDSKED